MSSLPPSFIAKKAHILSLLSVPATEYDDLSPKGSIDIGIRDLIDEINALPGLVTTSSCAGRVSVFLEGRKNVVKGDEEGGRDGMETKAGVGGKGGGGRWLFVSHDPVAVDKGEKEEEKSWAQKMGMCRLLDGETGMDVNEQTRLIHFKFEPMILHILTSSLQQAQLVLSAALQSGFRESGALNLTTTTTSNQHDPATPMVGIRSMGLGLESVVGYHVEDGKDEEGEKQVCMIPEWQLKHLVVVANERFVENTKRIERFRTLLKECMVGGNEGKEKMGDVGKWESVEERRERKRAEGLRRAREVKGDSLQEAEAVPDLTALELNL